MKVEQTAVGAGVLALALLLGRRARRSFPATPATAASARTSCPGWSASLLVLCGAALLWEAASGGFRDLEKASGAARGHWPGFVWVSVGLLANAALITRGRLHSQLHLVLRAGGARLQVLGGRGST